MEGKAKLAELIAEALFLQQRQLAENKAEQLRVQEKLAKAKARSQVYEERENTCTEMIRNDQRERYGCSGTSIKQEQSIQKGEVRQNLLMYHQT